MASVKTIGIYIVIAALLVGGGYLLGGRSVPDISGTIADLRQELGRAGYINSSLQADNIGLRQINSSLTTELAAAKRELAEIDRIAGSLESNNRQDAERANRASELVAKIKDINRQVREGNSKAQTK